MEAYCIYAGYAAVAAIMIVGFAGAFVPAIPGAFLAFGGVLGFKLLWPEALDWWCVWACLVLAAVSFVADFVFSYMGAKKMGASWIGGAGAFAGAIVGLFLPPPVFWVFVMPFFGAFLFELLAGRGLRVSGKAGLGAFFGNLASCVFKFATVATMALLFVVDAAGK